MKIKTFLVVGDAKTPVVTGVEKTVNAFLEKNPKLSVAHIAVNPDLSTTAGKAFVTVAYEGELQASEVPATPAVPAPAAPPAHADPAEGAETPKE